MKSARTAVTDVGGASACADFGKRRALTSPISASGGRLVCCAFGLSKCRHIRNTWQRCNIDFVPSAPSHLTTDAPPESVLTEEPTDGAEKGGFCGADGGGGRGRGGAGAGRGRGPDAGLAYRMTNAMCSSLPCWLDNSASHWARHASSSEFAVYGRGSSTVPIAGYWLGAWTFSPVTLCGMCVLRTVTFHSLTLVPSLIRTLCFLQRRGHGKRGGGGDEGGSLPQLGAVEPKRRPISKNAEIAVSGKHNPVIRVRTPDIAA